MPRQQCYRLPGVPQHVIQRGNNRQVTFFDESDYSRYLEALREAAEQWDCNIHAYVLMTNHEKSSLTPFPYPFFPFLSSVGTTSRLYL